MPLLSIIVAAYNAAPFIERAIASVIDQDFADWEMLIVDDASTDDTRDVVARVAAREPRIRLICLEANGGPSVARNEGIRRAAGEWVVVLDADDTFLPGRLSRIARCAAEGSEVIADNIVFRDDASGQLVGTAFRRIEGSWPFSALDVVRSERTWPGFRMGFLKPALKRSLLIDHAIFYDSRVRHGEDFLLLVRALMTSSRSVIIGEPGYVYTQQVSASTAKKSATTRSRLSSHDRVLTGAMLAEVVADSRDRSLQAAVRAYHGRMTSLARASDAVAGVKQRKPGSYRKLIALGPGPLVRFALIHPQVKRLLTKARLARSIAS